MDRQFDWQKVYGSEGMGINSVKHGVVRLFLIENREVCVYRDQKQLFAFEPTCPHHGASLKEGKCIEDIIECPLHKYRFSMKTGKNVSGEGYHLSTFPVKVWNEALYIGFPK